MNIEGLPNIEETDEPQKLSAHKTVATVKPLSAPLLPDDALPSKVTVPKPKAPVVKATTPKPLPALAPEPEVAPSDPEPAIEPEQPAILDQKALAKQQAVDETTAAKHAADVQAMVSKQTYYLPINSVERQRTKHFVIGGLLLSLILVLIWLDIALDAGLIQLGDTKSVTHFFSS
jgi:hypothetical protein